MLGALSAFFLVFSMLSFVVRLQTMATTFAMAAATLLVARYLIPYLARTPAVIQAEGVKLASPAERPLDGYSEPLMDHRRAF